MAKQVFNVDKWASSLAHILLSSDRQALEFRFWGFWEASCSFVPSDILGLFSDTYTTDPILALEAAITLMDHPQYFVNKLAELKASKLPVVDHHACQLKHSYDSCGLLSICDDCDLPVCTEQDLIISVNIKPGQLVHIPYDSNFDSDIARVVRIYPSSQGKCDLVDYEIEGSFGCSYISDLKPFVPKPNQQVEIFEPLPSLNLDALQVVLEQFVHWFKACPYSRSTNEKKRVFDDAVSSISNEFKLTPPQSKNYFWGVRQRLDLLP